MPAQSTGRDEPANHRLGIARELLVVDLDETLRRQHAAPVIGQTLVASKVGNQLVTPGRKRKAGMEQGLVNRERGVDGGAPTMDDRCLGNAR